VASDVPVLRILVPGNAAGGAANLEIKGGIWLENGLAFVTTPGVGDTSATAVAANEVIVNLLYSFANVR
jgi:hypothetical protein